MSIFERYKQTYKYLPGLKVHKIRVMSTLYAFNV